MERVESVLKPSYFGARALRFIGEALEALATGPCFRHDSTPLGRALHMTPSQHILVVDDSPTILRVVSSMLTRHGYEASVARDGLRGIDHLKQVGIPDLVLLDFVMPRMNGYQFCRELRSNPKFRHCPVVLMSAKGDKIRGQFVQQTGAIDSITKPFDAKSLIGTVRRALTQPRDYPRTASGKALRIFISYSKPDEAYLEELVAHLSLLRRLGTINTWHQRELTPGMPWQSEVRAQLDEASVVLLLISSDFMASPSCWDEEMARALRRHNAGMARVIPILVRPCDWQGAPFSELHPVPSDAKPVQLWSSRDEAWTDVVKRIRAAVTVLRGEGAPAPVFRDEESQRLSVSLEKARSRQWELEAAGEDTNEVRREILEIRRALREGGRLRPGDRLGSNRYLLLECIQP